MTIVNDDSRVIKKLEASLTDVDRVVIYDLHMFISSHWWDKIGRVFANLKLRLEGQNNKYMYTLF
jgi:hypothetical protein